MTAYRQHTINCKGRLLNLQKPLVMGILNSTPDSFFDGGQYAGLKQAISQVQKMLSEGADIIDIGGYSSRPGADEVTVQEELDRTIPLIKALLEEQGELIISIDTFRSEVALQAIEAGASIVNDISAGDDDPSMIPSLSNKQVPYIAMHKKGSPKTMQVNPDYEDVNQEVFNYLAHKIKTCREAGIQDVIIDPGFGFGKTLDHNFSLMNHLDRFKILETPVLVGISRKSMIRKALNVPSSETLNGTSILNTIALLKGGSILRVHDVKEAREAIRLVDLMNA